MKKTALFVVGSVALVAGGIGIICRIVKGRLNLGDNQPIYKAQLAAP